MDFLTRARQKSERLMVGLMSGTSADGVDACLCAIQGFGLDTDVEIKQLLSQDYSDEVKNMLIEGLPDLCLEDIARLNFAIGRLFAQTALKCIEEAGYTPSQIDAVCSHGQTLIHLPDSNHQTLPQPATLQIGDISVIAKETGILTIGDFRPADMAQGGQGAPLVPYADFILFRDDHLGRVVQNIGGISNLTYLPPGCCIDDILAFDTGPGNMVMDAVVRILTDGKLSMDTNGQLASSGDVNHEFLEKILSHGYFRKPPPKSTGREFFGIQYAKALIDIYSQFVEDGHWNYEPSVHLRNIVRTVSEATVQSITEAYKTWVIPKGSIDEVVLGGGGAYNLYLKERLTSELASLNPNARLLTHEDFGIPNKAKEALAFCILGNDLIGLLPNNVPSATGAHKPTILGKIAFP